MRTPDPKYATLAAKLAKMHADATDLAAATLTHKEALFAIQVGLCAICEGAITPSNAELSGNDLVCWRCDELLAEDAALLKKIIRYQKRL